MTKCYFLLMLHVHCELLGLCSQEPGGQSCASDLARGKEVVKHQLGLTSIQVEWLCPASGREGKLVLVNEPAGRYRLHGRGGI